MSDKTLCTTCHEPYTKPSTSRAMICSNSFHCCRDCKWQEGRRTYICIDCKSGEGTPEKRNPGVGWATQYIQKLIAGENVQFRPRGNSMQGKIESGQLCTVIPLLQMPDKGDVVLCKVGCNQYLHLVTAIKGDRIQISNNKGFVNGWIGLESVYGLLTAVED